MSPGELSSGVKLHGSWQSCRDSDGVYGERVYDHYRSGRHEWSLHLGPRDEFALYQGFGPDGDDHTHDSLNLLAPAYHANDVATWRGKRTWSVPSLRLLVNVVQAGGSRDECDSFIILVETLK